MTRAAADFIAARRGFDPEMIAEAFPAGGPSAAQVRNQLNRSADRVGPAARPLPPPVRLSDGFDPSQLTEQDWQEVDTIYEALKAGRRLPDGSQSLGTRPDGHELTSIKVWATGVPRTLEDVLRGPQYAGLMDTLDVGMTNTAGQKNLQTQSLLLKSAENGRVFLIISKKAEEGLDDQTVLKLRTFAGSFGQGKVLVELRQVQKHLAQLCAFGKYLNGERSPGPWKLGALLDHCLKGTAADPEWDAAGYLMMRPEVSGYLSAFDEANRTAVSQALHQALEAFITGGHQHGLRPCTSEDRRLLVEFAQAWPTRAQDLSEGSRVASLERFADWLAEQELGTLEARTRPLAADNPLAALLERRRQTASELEQYAHARGLSPRDKESVAANLTDLTGFRASMAAMAAAGAGARHTERP